MHTQLLIGLHCAHRRVWHVAMQREVLLLSTVAHGNARCARPSARCSRFRESESESPPQPLGLSHCGVHSVGLTRIKYAKNGNGNDYSFSCVPKFQSVNSMLSQYDMTLTVRDSEL